MCHKSFINKFDKETSQDNPKWNHNTKSIWRILLYDQWGQSQKA